jgi:hypothetical protein
MVKPPVRANLLSTTNPRPKKRANSDPLLIKNPAMKNEQRANSFPNSEQRAEKNTKLLKNTQNGVS